MHRVGIGCFQIFDAALMTPQILEKTGVFYPGFFRRFL
jgi:hypothetical protein